MFYKVFPRFLRLTQTGGSNIMNLEPLPLDSSTLSQFYDVEISLSQSNSEMFWTINPVQDTALSSTPFTNTKEQLYIYVVNDKVVNSIIT